MTFAVISANCVAIACEDQDNTANPVSAVASPCVAETLYVPPVAEVGTSHNAL